MHRRLSGIFAAFAAVLIAVAPVWADEPFNADLVRVSEPFMVSPHDMTLTPDEKYLVIADMGQDRVLLLDPEQLTIQAVIGEGSLSVPHDVVFDKNDRLLVADSGNDRIVIYALNGTTATQIDEWTGFDGPEGIAPTPDGCTYIAVTLANQLICYQDGQVLAQTQGALGGMFDRPHDVDILPTADGLNVVVTDPGNHRLVVLDRTLNAKYEISTWDPPLSEPKYISVNEQGRIFVADQFNNAVRVFSANGVPIATFARQHVRLPEGVLARGNRVWVSDSEGGRVLLYRIGKTP